MRLCHVCVASLLCYASSTILLEIISPDSGASLDLADLRANGGVNVDISVEVETHAEFIHDVNGSSICIYINGSTFPNNLKFAAAKGALGLLDDLPRVPEAERAVAADHMGAGRGAASSVGAEGGRGGAIARGGCDGRRCC